MRASFAWEGAKRNKKRYKDVHAWMISSTSLARKVFLRLIATLFLSISMFWCNSAIADCDGRKVDVGGYALWMQSRGSGTPTVVFESGGGEDSSEWSNIEPVIRERAKVKTVIYDRAGLGKSDPNPRPYRVEDEGTDGLSIYATSMDPS
jgi:hypothetical protein